MALVCGAPCQLVLLEHLEARHLAEGKGPLPCGVPLQTWQSRSGEASSGKAKGCKQGGMRDMNEYGRFPEGHLHGFKSPW